MARRLMGTKRFLKLRDERKRVETRFAHLKTHHGFDREEKFSRNQKAPWHTERRSAVAMWIKPLGALAFFAIALG
jgi:hypothetical protein